MTGRLLIGQILVADGAVSEVVLARALGYQRATRQSFRLGSILLDWDLLAEDKLLEALSKLHHCPPASWAELSKASPEALQAFSAAYAVRLGAFPYAVEGSGLRVAFRNPSDLAAVDEASSVSSKRVIPAVATEAALVLAYHRFYGRPVPPDFRDLVQKFARAKIALRRPGRRTDPAASAVSGPKSAGNDPSSSAIATVAKSAAPRIARAMAPPVEERVSPAPARAPAPVSMPKPPFPRAAPPWKPGAERSRARIAQSVADTLLALFPRVLVLGVEKSAIRCWTGRGPGLTPEIIASIRVRSAGDTVLPEVARSGVPHFGPLETERLSLGLRGMLEREAPACAVFPVRVFDAVVGLLYADRLGDPMIDGDFTVLSDAAETLAKLLSESGRPGGETG